jgi:serine protease Do
MSRGPTAPIETQMEDGRIMVMLGMGLVFGSFGIPERALLTMKSFWTPALIGDDPLAAMQGRPDYHPLDLTVMQMTPTPAADLIATLPMKSRQPGLRVGDVVVAVGFPEIETFKGTLADAVTTIREGMYAAYGVVTRLYPEGRENNRLGTPLFEVEANWPSGMSGGPVLNKDGEIIGLVSRSIAPEAGQKTGTGWATWFAPFSDFDKWLPSLDPDNPCWRKGWAVRRSAPWSIHGVYPTTEDAEHALVEAGPGYEVVFGSWRVGSDDFMSSQTVYS